MDRGKTEFRIEYSGVVWSVFLIHYSTISHIGYSWDRQMEDMHNEEICHTDDTWIKLDPSDNPNIYALEILHTTHRSASLVHHDRRCGIHLTRAVSCVAVPHCTLPVWSL